MTLTGKIGLTPAAAILARIAPAFMAPAGSGFNEYTLVLVERFTPGPAAHPAIRGLKIFVSTRTVIAVRSDGSQVRSNLYRKMKTLGMDV